MSTFDLLTSTLETVLSLKLPFTESSKSIDSPKFKHAQKVIQVTDPNEEEERYRHLHRFDGECYPKNISRRMLTTSCVMSVAAICAFAHECYLLSVLVCAVVLCSINYWRKPQRGLRRNIDIMNSVSVSSFHMLYALYAMQYNAIAIQYIKLVLSGLVLFGCSKVAAKNGYQNVDSFFHCGMHLYGIFVNCWCYTQIYEYRSIEYAIQR
eukprot:CAMPEP_0202690106 /NCGR_PEP_ID=MMETSP1385-20130828/5211_1 /ASSEMBLY_ACC=CAM_ASM_000861 /TAXON_ID=933848 /ORGANISM="Elphidium margaritaceum" /LENGTH=208 /DNA_ID=CAMNT_0049345335 /DNA_START=61 /DNA_END=687 /DNA_ORIENTATION=-